MLLCCISTDCPLAFKDNRPQEQRIALITKVQVYFVSPDKLSNLYVSKFKFHVLETSHRCKNTRYLHCLTLHCHGGDRRCICKLILEKKKIVKLITKYVFCKLNRVHRRQGICHEWKTTGLQNNSLMHLP